MAKTFKGNKGKHLHELVPHRRFMVVLVIEPTTEQGYQHTLNNRKQDPRRHEKGPIWVAQGAQFCFQRGTFRNVAVEFIPLDDKVVDLKAGLTDSSVEKLRSKMQQLKEPRQLRWSRWTLALVPTVAP